MALLLGSGIVFASTDDSDPRRESAARIAVGTCAGCHGARGVSTQPKFPNLAGQSAGYLATQLKAFKARTRNEPDALAYMWGIAGSLDEQEIAGLAEYYASQSPAEGVRRHPTEEARGKRIFETGIPAQHVAPCFGCHGANAEGSIDFPRLAGQREPYFVSQMRAFQRRLRSGDTMQAIAGGLKDEDLQALAAYVKSR